MAGQHDSPLGSTSPVHPGDPIDLLDSVAGEEDPGASMDLPPAAADRGPACPRCGGSGKLGASACPDCGGTGRLHGGA